MKFSRILAVASIVTLFTFTTAFAAPADTSANNESQRSMTVTESKPHFKGACGHNRSEFEKDPIKALQGKKEKIQSLLKDGKITKEKADEMISGIDSKIKEIQNFDKLTLPQKKEKLTNDFKAHIESRVKEGKLDRSKADHILKNFTEKINKWDGTGYPKLHLKHKKDK